MNWVDLVIIATLTFFALESVTRSAVLELLDFVSFLVAFFLSFSCYNILAKLLESNFQTPHSLSLVLGFISVWFLSEALFYILIRIFFPTLPRIKFLESKFYSIIPATLRGLIFISLILVMIATFPIQPSVKKAVLDSKIGSRILKNAYALEQPVKAVFGGVTEDSLTFLTIKPKTDQRINLGFKTSNYTVDGESEGLMIRLTNNERVSRGLKPLVFDSSLESIARSYSEDMFARGYFSHYSPEGLTVADRVLKMGIDFIVVGENLAYAPSVDSAQKGLMNSEGHRANILSKDYTKIGIGVMDGGVYGKMFTQVFTN